MFLRNHAKVTHQSVFVLLIGLCVALFSPIVDLSAQGVAQIEPDAGKWQTWVLQSGSQFRLSEPPDATATADEIAQLNQMESQRDDATLQQIAYWNTGGPAYRWNQIAVESDLTPLDVRQMALFHVAIYDATIAAWDSKYVYNRPRPSEVDATLTTAIPNPASPSYPSEYAVTAGAASTILAWLFPDKAQAFQDLAQQAVHSRLLAGVEFPSDVEAGLTLGQQVAEQVIAYGTADGSDAQWTGSVPTEPGHWTGQNPVSPMAGTWKTWVLTSGDQFRPPPPPAYDSQQEVDEMAQLKNFQRTPATNAIANFWQFGVGPTRSYWFWNNFSARGILEAGWENDPPMAARAYALVSIAEYDAFVACWDAKYTYWAIRPFQLDPTFTPLFNTPNHPSYPAAHATISAAAADVLAYLFPWDAQEATAMAQQAGESRIWAGIHFLADVRVGEELGKDVGDEVIQRATSDGAA